MKQIYKFIRLILLIVTSVVMIWGLLNMSLVEYGWSQLKGQVKIVWNAKPLDEIMNDPNFPDSLKEKIRVIDIIANYAQDSLGLNRSKNYKTLFDEKGKAILWTITACDKYEFKPYQWKFPILGSVSYKGFFNYRQGFVEDSILQSQGYDTDYGEVSAWSTLGWFKDPILSNMLRRTEGQLAELIIHEMTHATVYLKSNVDLNENLASMIGEEGALRFLASHFGKDSKQLSDYKARKSDYDLFTRYMLLSHDRLDSLYNKISTFSLSEKEILKQTVINEIIVGLDSIQFQKPKRYSKLFSERKPNNAYFMNFVRYDSQKDEMKKNLNDKYNGNIEVYLNAMRKQ